MSGGPRVRLAEAGDLEALARLSGELGYAAEREAFAQRLTRLRADPDARLWVACDDDGVVRGWLHVALQEGLTQAPFGLILGLVVEPSTHGAGFGSALVESAARWSEEQGASLLRVRSRVEREDAHGFYRSRGFRVLKTQVAFERPLGGADA